MVVTIKKHTDIVLTLLYIKRHDVLLSGSVDPFVYMWDCSNSAHKLKVGQRCG